MEKWGTLLNSLATKGGNILVLMTVTLVLGGALVHVLHHSEINVEARALVLSSFSGAFGALLLSLQNGGGGQRKVDNGGAKVDNSNGGVKL